MNFNVNMNTSFQMSISFSLFFHFNNHQSTLSLFESNSEIVREYISRLYNTLASLARGRDYLLQVSGVYICQHVQCIYALLLYVLTRLTFFVGWFACDYIFASTTAERGFRQYLPPKHAWRVAKAVVAPRATDHHDPDGFAFMCIVLIVCMHMHV